jgi:hypothetical protein
MKSFSDVPPVRITAIKPDLTVFDAGLFRHLKGIFYSSLLNLNIEIKKRENYAG